MHHYNALSARGAKASSDLTRKCPAQSQRREDAWRSVRTPQLSSHLQRGAEGSAC